MKNIYLFLLSLPFLLFSCQEDNPQQSEINNTIDTVETRQDSAMNEKQKKSDPEYTPLYDMVDVEFEDDQYTDTNVVRGRDARYYNFYAYTDREYTVSLESDYDHLNLMIFPPEGDKLLNQNTEGNAVEWTGKFETSGMGTFHVSIDTKNSYDDTRAAYTIVITEK